jgi:purine-binding chemotaxis protein CheW
VRLDSLEMGILVDKVSEVLEMRSESIDSIPYFGIGLNTNFILRLGKSHSKVRILLDMDNLLSSNEVTEVHFSIGEVASMSSSGPWSGAAF